MEDKSNPSAGQEQKLNLPIAPNFYSPLPQLTPTEYYEWCEEMRSTVNKNPADRAAKMCPVEFVLKD
jgi:hypothetical protein